MLRAEVFLLLHSSQNFWPARQYSCSSLPISVSHSFNQCERSERKLLDLNINDGKLKMGIYCMNMFIEGTSSSETPFIPLLPFPQTWLHAGELQTSLKYPQSAFFPLSLSINHSLTHTTEKLNSAHLFSLSTKMYKKQRYCASQQIPAADRLFACNK